MKGKKKGKVTVKVSCPRIANYIVNRKECRRCETIRGPCDYAEGVQSMLTDLVRIIEEETRCY